MRPYDLLRPLVDAVLPPRCPGCGAIVEADHRFCGACWASLDFLTGPGCAHCGIPLPGIGDLLCGRCLARPPRHDRVHAAVAYGPVARHVALRLKYARRPGLARTIAAVLAHRVTFDPQAMLVPVPLHRWRLWSRGFNQAAAIAAALGRRSGLPVDLDLVARRRATPSMRGLDPGARRRAVRGAFAVRSKLDGRAVYLVDDIYTTGATAEAIAGALKRAGASRVDVLCWARVVRDD